MKRRKTSECIELLPSVTDKNELDRHGKEILSILEEDGEWIVKHFPDILIGLIRNAGDLIDSVYYVDIIKAFNLILLVIKKN